MRNVENRKHITKRSSRDAEQYHRIERWLQGNRTLMDELYGMFRYEKKSGVRVTELDIRECAWINSIRIPFPEHDVLVFARARMAV